MKLKVGVFGILLLVVLAAIYLDYGIAENSVTVPLVQASGSPPAVTCGIHCGTERWAVKTLTDADHGNVNFHPKKTSISWLTSQDPPDELPEDGRVPPVETQTYQVKAVLVGFKLEKDKDFHIVLADPEESGLTMIVEIPDPSCSGVCTSSQLDDITKARQDFTDHCGKPTTGFKTLEQRLVVTATGVGFFDFLHGQKGVADNGIELHPVLGIEFPTDTNECQMWAHHMHSH